jgi:hypothetical protein
LPNDTCTYLNREDVWRQTLFTNQIMIAMITIVPTIPYPNI